MTGRSLELSGQPVYEQDSDLVKKLCPTNRVGSWGYSSLGRVLTSQARGSWFDSQYWIN